MQIYYQGGIAHVRLKKMANDKSDKNTYSNNSVKDMPVT